MKPADVNESTIKKTAALSFLEDGGELGQLTRDFDWSQTSIGSPDKWPLSLRTTLGIILHSAFPMFLFWGKEYICFYNDAYRPSLGEKGKHPAVGKCALDVWPEIWQFIGPLIEQVSQTGKPVWFEDQLLPIFRNGQMEDVYWTFSYSPAYGDQGEIGGILVTCTETTEKVNQMKQLQESQDLFRTLILEAPVATCLFLGREMRIEIANDRMIDFWGKDKSVIGQPLELAVPELKGQPFLGILQEVYDTGIPYEAQEMPALLNVGGKLSQYYFDFTYTPIRDRSGQVYGITDMAVDVTGQVVARQMLVQSERNLRNMIMKAPVAMCIFKGPKHVVETANDRMIELWGRTAGEILFKSIFEGLPEVRDQGFETLLNNVFETGQAYVAHGVPVNLPRDGMVQTIYINFVYEALREADAITGVIAVATEVTEQVLARQQIEQIVSERTKALAEANENLQKSNEELAQFAYIASHDLQEPLRKVSTFTEMLESSLGTQSDTSKSYFNRIRQSTARMTSLIRDVLAYSQLARKANEFEQVNLAKVIELTMTDFELLIEQKKAVIHISDLPIVTAIPLQMSQLFGNLVANALKFSKPDTAPVISITASILANPHEQEEMPYDASNTYYDIEVRDNGIGFEQQHAGQIFQIFQRLHGKTEYSGTGIGLAMCKKIAQNHHGTIYAESRPSSGAVFHVILPVSTSRMV